jgi:hypothetical protein
VTSRLSSLPAVERGFEHERRRFAPGARLLVRDCLWLALIGLTVQAFWAWRLEHPTYMDAYYYAGNGRRLAQGLGFSEMIVWHFFDQPAALPVPSHTYWMPLPSLLAAGGYKLFGTFRGAQVPFWLLAGLLPLVSYTISRHISGERWQAWTAGLLTAGGGFFAVYWNQPESFAPFAWAGSLCLLFLALAHVRRPARYWFLAGVAAGLAHLTRADGVLLLLVAGGWWFWQAGPGLVKARDGVPAARRHTAALLLLLAGYFLIMGGWLVRNGLVLGRPLPVVGTQTIFMTTYDDLFAYGRALTPALFWQWGWANILASRWAAVWAAVQTFIAVAGLIFLAPLVLFAWWRLWRLPAGRTWLAPLTTYTVLLFVAMSLLFAFPGMRGGLFHSITAVWPWFMALAAAGLALVIDAVAARRPYWNAHQARRVYAAMAVVLAFALTFAVGLGRGTGEQEAAVYRQIGLLLPPGAVVMVGNAPGLYYHTGLAAVSVPNELAPIMLEAARQYGVTHVVLDENRPRPLDDLYRATLTLPELRLVEQFDGVRIYEVTAVSP